MQAVVSATGRHLNIDDCHIGPVRERLAQEPLGVARLGDDVEARLDEQPRDSLAQQDVVLTEYDACNL
jgi:hypothetical protein